MLISWYFCFLDWTPLHEACNHGHYKIAKFLAKSGAFVNAAGLEGDTPLHDASSNGHLKVGDLIMDPNIILKENDKMVKWRVCCIFIYLHLWYVLTQGHLHTKLKRKRKVMTKIATQQNLKDPAHVFFKQIYHFCFFSV